MNNHFGEGFKSSVLVNKTLNIAITGIPIANIRPTVINVAEDGLLKICCKGQKD